MKFILNPFYWGRFPVIVAILMSTCVYGQGFSISGRTYNEAGKKIGSVRIVLYNIDKKKVVDFKTPGSGKFKLKNIPDGNYTMNYYGEGGYGGTENISVNGENLNDLSPTLQSLDDQPQIKLKPIVGGVEINWRKTVGAVEFIIYRNNEEVGTVAETIYTDKIEAGTTHAYNVVAVKSDQSKGARSVTEYSKALLPAPKNVTTKARKNIVKLDWDSIEGVSVYNVYRDGEMVNSSSENSYTDFKLKYGTEFSYTVAALDHQEEEGDRSIATFTTTHIEMLQPEKLKAESGPGSMGLTWRPVTGAVKYLIYLNGALVDSAEITSASVSAEPGADNCFTVSAKDQYGTVGTQSKAACDKSVYPPPETVTGENEISKNLIEWSVVDGASSYNIYRNDDLLSNTSKTAIKDGVLKWDRVYSYHITSLTSDGVEGPASQKIQITVPPVFIIDGKLVNEQGNSNDVDQAKIFLYAKGGKLQEEFTVSNNGKFRFEKEIIKGEYTLKAYGNGSGNGGERIQVVNSDLNDVKISLSTDGLRPTITVERGVGQLTVHWNDLPAAKHYVVYKNNRLLATIVDELSYTDPQVAPGIPTNYDVRTVDVYDLEGPKSNEITETSSFNHPNVTPLVYSGAYTEDGSGRIIKFSWQGIAGVDSYAFFKNGTLLSKQSETTYIDSNTTFNTNYNYEINSIDKDKVEGVNSPKILVTTHKELLAPTVTIEPLINSISLAWASQETVTNYKIFRNGSNIADTPDSIFVDNVKPGVEYCYTVSVEDSFQTVGPKAETKCDRGLFAPPGNFSGKVIRNEVTLSWTVTMGATGFRIYRDGKLFHSTPDGTDYIDDSLAFDTEYLYEIASIDQDDYEGPRQKIQMLTHEKVLETELSGESDLQKISLAWERSILSKTDFRYRIYRDGELLDETTEIKYQDFVPAGQFFCYTITIVDQYGTESLKSNEECHKVLVNFPKNLVINGDVKRMMFEWKKMIGAEFYNIYAVDKTTQEEKFHTKTKQYFYEHKDLPFDTEFCYKVSSVDADGDEGPLSEIQCGWVLPPPHITLVEKRFMEGSGNGILDGREHGWIIVKIVNDGRSPARELKPWLEYLDGEATPSLKIDQVTMIPKLDVGDTLTIQYPLYAKLKIESGERKFNIRVDEFTGVDLEPEPISFRTLKIIPPNLVITDFAIDNEWGQHYIPINEVVTISVRIQNLSEGKSDTASIRFRRDSTFVSNDEDELHEFGFVNAGEVLDFKFEILSRVNKFSVHFDLYDYFETKNTQQIHLETMKAYKGADEMIVIETPYPDELIIGEAEIVPELIADLQAVSTDRGTIGIVLGNQIFWDPEIEGKPSTTENVKMVREYFHDLFGMADHTIIPSQYWFFNEGISSRDFQALFDPDLGILRKKIESSISYSGESELDLFLYFSGEGTTYKGEKVIIPFDADTTKEFSFYSLKNMYENLKQIQRMSEIGEITLFMDVDFNNSAFPQYLKKPVAEIVEDSKAKKKKRKKKKNDIPEEPIVFVDEEIMPPKTITAFYASTSNQVTHDHPDIDNTVFTYYLLKGMRGEADNGDKELTVAELYDYISKNVTDTTGKLYKDLPQVPQLFSSNPDRILYRLP
jgi:fibronectin type 3 domain-containing protein